MIKLFALAGACSYAPHIILKETNLPHEVKFLKRGGTPETWTELEKVNAMRQVPAIVTDEGYPLTEVTAILQYLNYKGGEKLFPTSGKERFKGFEWLNFTATELHKGFSPLFSTGDFSADEAAYPSLKAKAHENMNRKLRIADGRFDGDEFAVANRFTIVDAYLFVVLSWAKYVKIDVAQYPKLDHFVTKMSQRPSVVAATTAERSV